MYYNRRFVKDMQGYHDNWWLNAPWDKGKYDLYTLSQEIPFYGTYVNNLYAKRANQEYLSRYGMDYSDIHDPRNLWSVGGSHKYGVVPTPSRNIEKLYR